MVQHCVCYGCNERFVKGGTVSFHSFPKDEIRARIWLEKINRENFVNTRNSKVCSKHFTEDCFDREKFGGVWLKKDAVPTVFNFSKYKQKPSSRKRLAKSCLSGGSQNQRKHTENILYITAPSTSTNRKLPYSIWCITLLPQLLPTSEQSRPDERKREGESNRTQCGGETQNESTQSLCGEEWDHFMSAAVTQEQKRGRRRRKVLRRDGDSDGDALRLRMVVNSWGEVAREETVVTQEVESGRGGAVNADRRQKRGRKRKGMLCCGDNTDAVEHKLPAKRGRKRKGMLCCGDDTDAVKHKLPVKRGRKRKKVLRCDDDTDAVKHKLPGKRGRKRKDILRCDDNVDAVVDKIPAKSGRKRRKVLRPDDDGDTVGFRVVENTQDEVAQEETVVTREVESGRGGAVNADRRQNFHGVFVGDEIVVKRGVESDHNYAMDPGRRQEADFREFEFSNVKEEPAEPKSLLTEELSGQMALDPEMPLVIIKEEIDCDDNIGAFDIPEEAE